jgi:transcriptional regulator with XRE-family HTH domain
MAHSANRRLRHSEGWGETVTIHDPFYVRFGQRVQRYRVARQLTQEQLGRLLVPAMTRASVANIENAKQRVLAHTVAQLARGLNVTEAQLFGRRP